MNHEKDQKSIFEISVSGHSTGALCSLLRPLEHFLDCLDPLLPLRRGLNFEEVRGRGEQKYENLKTSIFASSLFFNSGCQSLEKTTEVAYCPAGQFLVNIFSRGFFWRYPRHL